MHFFPSRIPQSFSLSDCHQPAKVAFLLQDTLNSRLLSKYELGANHCSGLMLVMNVEDFKSHRLVLQIRVSISVSEASPQLAP